MLKSYFQSRGGSAVAAVLAAALCQAMLAQDPTGKEAPGKDAQVQAKGLPPRATPADYQANARAGSITIAAEFTGHSVSTPQAVLATEDYVVVEVGLFGPPEARVRLSDEDFSVRINGKKIPLPAQPYAMIYGSLKDPEWEPPIPVESKSKTSIGGSGQGQNDPNATPKVVHIPIEVERGWQQRVQKAALPEGERALPAAGLIFFKYHGKVDGIDSIELMYAGAAGKATLQLHP